MVDKTENQINHAHHNASRPHLSQDKYLVPNIVHFIWYEWSSPRPFMFHNMLSMLSAYKYLNPDRIYFHTNKEPSGKFWHGVLQIPTLRIIHRQPPTQYNGHRFPSPRFDSSSSDVDRVIILTEYGGIYLDLDVLVVSSKFHSVRTYNCTMGIEAGQTLCGGIIVCNKNSTFLKYWLDRYVTDNRPNHWSYNSGWVPSQLAKDHPNLLHIVPRKFHMPNWFQLQYLFGDKKYNWRANYAVHLWNHKWEKNTQFKKLRFEYNEETIKYANNTFGEIAREILYHK